MGKITIIEGNSNDKDNVRAYMVKGEAGVSPTVETSSAGGVSTITITDAEGTHEIELNDGVSPTVDVSKEDGVTTVVIHDVDGDHTATIADGVDLEGGVPTNAVIGWDSEDTIPDGYEEYNGVDNLIVFNNVASMQASNLLLAGNKVKTLGYYAVNDGGEAEYEIVDDETLVADNALIYSLSSGLFAKLIIRNNTINIKQLGARSQDKNNNKYDIKTYIEKYIGICDKLENRIKLYIPAGIWYSSPIDIAREEGWFIYGDEGFIGSRALGTIITTLTNNQEYLIHFGDNTKFSANIVLKNIIFSTNDYYYNSTYNVFATNNTYRKSVTDSLIKFLYCEYATTDKLFFEHINGTALEITSSWEMYFPLLNFRDVNAINSCVMKFGQRDTTLLSTANITAITFENIMFEKVLGDLIYSAQQSRLSNCVFNNINFEDWGVDYDGYTVTNFTSENIPTYEASNPYHQSLFRFGGLGTDIASDGCLIINNIQLNNTSMRFTTYNNTNYCYDRVISVNGNYSAVSLIINNIDSIGMIKDNCLLYSQDSVYQSSQVIIGEINNIGSSNFYIDVDNFPYIKCDSRLRGNNSSDYFYMPSNVTPAYKLVNNKNTGNRYLKSDSSCQNNLKIATKILNNTPSINFVLASLKLYLRAKVASGSTARIVFSSPDNSNTETVDLVGTGDYAIYEINIPTAKFSISSNMFLALATNTATALVDYIIN